jgi:hypothetical protein
MKYFLQRSTCLLALAAALSGPVLATPVTEWRGPDLLMMAPDLKAALKLNANQATLWQQTEGRTRTLLRARQSRQEKLQASALQALQGKGVELRDLTGALDAEEATLSAEARQLREWWLTVNDALDETQRQAVAVFLAEQLQRKPEAPGGTRGEGPPRERGGEGHGGRGKGGPGGINIGLGER